MVQRRNYTAQVAFAGLVTLPGSLASRDPLLSHSQ